MHTDAASAKSQTVSGVIPDSALATHNLVDPLDRHTNMPGKRYLRKPKRVRKFLQQDFSGVGGKTVFWEHGYSFPGNNRDI